MNSILFRGSICYPRRPTNYIRRGIPIIRSWFKGEIVVATWKDQEKHLEGIEGIDKVVFLDDPGELRFTNKQAQSTSAMRQFVSFREGISSCNGDVVCVIRPDIMLYEDPFSHFDPCNYAVGKYRVFQRKVVVGNMMTIRPNRESPHESYFRIGDWFHMGIREDLKRLGCAVESERDNYDSAGNNYTDCTERIWFLSLINTFNQNKVLLSNYHNLQEHDAWEALLGNFVVLNSRSTLKTDNMNWLHQNEFLPCYLTEEQYLDRLRMHRFDINTMLHKEIET